MSVPGIGGAAAAFPSKLAFPGARFGGNMGVAAISLNSDLYRAYCDLGAVAKTYGGAATGDTVQQM